MLVLKFPRILTLQFVLLFTIHAVSIVAHHRDHDSTVPLQVGHLLKYTFRNCVATLIEHGNSTRLPPDMEAYVLFLQMNLDVPTVLAPPTEDTDHHHDILPQEEREIAKIKFHHASDFLRFTQCKFDLIFLRREYYRVAWSYQVVLQRMAAQMGAHTYFSLIIANEDVADVLERLLVKYGRAMVIYPQQRGITLFAIASSTNTTDWDVMLPLVTTDEGGIDGAGWGKAGQLPQLIPLKDFSGTVLKSDVDCPNALERIWLEAYKRRSKLIRLGNLQPRLAMDTQRTKKKTCACRVHKIRQWYQAVRQDLQCFYRELAFNLNASYVPLTSDNRFLPRFSFNYNLTEGAVSLVKANRIYALTVTHHPCQLFVLLDREYITQSNINALLTSMDTATWIGTLLSIGALTVSYYTLKKESGASGVVSCGLTLFGSLLGQGFDAPTQPHRIRRQFMGLLGAWLLAIIVITNGYSAIMSALMTRHVLPPVPESLDQLAKSDYQVFSTSYAPYVDEITGRATHIVLPLPMGLQSNCRPCHVLADRIAYITPPATGNDLSLMYKNIFMGIVESRPINTTKGIRNFPQNFAMLEGNEARQTWSMLKTTLSDRKQIAYAGDAFPFAFQHIWAIEVEYLHRLVRPQYAALHESGIWGKWQEHYRLAGESAWNDGAVLHKAIQRARPLTAVLFQLPPFDEPPKPMKMGVLRIPLLVYAVCLALCLVTLAMEVCIRLVGSHMKRVELMPPPAATKSIQLPASTGVQTETHGEGKLLPESTVQEAESQLETAL